MYIYTDSLTLYKKKTNKYMHIHAYTILNSYIYKYISTHVKYVYIQI